MNDTYLFLQLDIDPSASSGESPLSPAVPLWRRFSRSQSQGEKQTNTQPLAHNGKNAHSHTLRLVGKLCHTPFHLFWWTYGNVSTSQETLANVRTCGWHGRGPHVRSVQLCLGPPAKLVPPLQCAPPSACTQEGN